MLSNLITRTLGVPFLVITLHGLTSLVSENENVCTNMMPGSSIRTFTKGSKNILDGAEYFNCYPQYARKPEIITWNKSILQPRDYQQLFCPGRCQEDKFVILDGYGTCSTLKCFPCDCDKPKCQIYGTCCPDVDDENNGVTDSRLKTQNTFHLTAADCGNTSQRIVQREKASVIPTNVGENLTLRCDKVNDSYSFMSIKSCPNYYSNNSVRTLCESKITPSELNISTYLRVSDKETSVTYFNEYCATCNDISEFTTWDLIIDCVHFQRVYTAQNDDEFLRLSLRNDSSCYVTQRPPSGYTRYECEPSWLKPVVSLCNVTGKWAKYDKDVFTSCAQTGSLLDRACFFDTDIFCYHNVFCALCNLPSYPKWLHECVRFCQEPLETELYLPFSLLFNFGNSKFQEQSQLLLQYNTSDSEWTSPDGRSLPLQCSPGKILLNGNCSSASKIISGLAYNMSILYVPKSLQLLAVNGTELLSLKSINYLTFWKSYLRTFSRKVNNIFKLRLEYMSLSTRIIIPKTVDQLWDTPIEQNSAGTFLKPHTCMWYFLNGVIIATNEQQRDRFENEIIQQLMSDEFTLNINANTSLIFTPVIVTDNQKHLFGDYYLKKNNLTYLESILETITPLDISAATVYSLFMAPEIICPFVTFTKSDYEIDVNNNLFPPTMNITLKFQTGNLALKNGNEINYLSINDQEDLRVCQHLLQRKLSPLMSVSINRQTTLFHALQILTISCISVSMLFLVLTLLTYILCLELRNSAGANIICLCSSLFLAQASLIVASQIKETGYFCTTSGITIHFLWLKVFCWCFTCSYTIFRVFTAKTRTIRSSSLSKKEQLIKLFLCLITPALVVCTVIGGNLLSSDNKRTGYGEKYCSLDSPLLMSITLLMPILVILLSNFIFYLISVREIHSVRKLQTADLLSKQKISKSIYIYLKLSTVTGTFWILTVISEATDIDALRVIAILLNGLQGVFIFVSFACNKRVLGMYKHQMSFKRQASNARVSFVEHSSKTI